MKTKIIVVGILLFVMLFTFSYIDSLPKIDCSQTGTIYLTPDESHYTSAILKQNPSVLVSIPESNQIVGASEVLKCNHPPAINFVKNKLGIN